LPYFPQLEKVSLEKAYTGKEVRYLPINTKLESGKGFQAKKLVFVKYSVEKQFSFNKIEKKKAIKTLLEETWINPKSDHVIEFFNWFEQCEFFEMEYWNISDALNVVQELFEE
jgi:hypothetical protein